MALNDRSKIVEVAIESEMKTSYIDYSMSVIVSRALPDEVFIIDLGQVHEFHDYSIAVLARVLAGSCKARIAVRGLRRHHVRLLRYFGIDVACAGILACGVQSDGLHEPHGMEEGLLPRRLLGALARCAARGD